MSLTLDRSSSSTSTDASPDRTQPRAAIDLTRTSARKRILMVSPDHFCVRYAINPWMTSGIAVDRDLACRQWETLRDAISRCVDVEVMPGDIGLPDMCFSANAGLIHGSIFVPSNFRNAERRPESALFADWMQRAGFIIRELSSDTVFEGAGDALFDREGRLWMGYGQRTDASAAAALSALIDTQVVPLELRDPRFYHLDTCFCPLQAGPVVFYPEAFAPKSLDTLRRIVPLHLQIPVASEDAVNFACNMIDLGETVLAHHASAGLCDALRRVGQQVVTVDLGEFLKAGGGAKCLTLALE